MISSSERSIGWRESDRRKACSMFRHASICVSLFFVCIFARVALAQVGTGAITGSVTDSSQAAVANATVTARNVQTNVVFKTKTNSAGAYNVPTVPIGAYELEVGAEGFKSSVESNIVIDVGRTARVDVTLQVGEVNQRITVSAEAPLLDPQTSATGTEVTRKMLSELPIEVSGTSRDPVSFINLTPGASGGTFSQNIVGGRAMANEVMVDGVPSVYNAMTNTTDTDMPSYDTIAEFRVVAGIPPAEFGRTSGGLVSLVTRSGTNELHGNADLLLRNNIFDARVYDAAKANIERQGEFAASLGGPVYIPKLYNGKDHTFFYVNYTGFRYADDTLGLTASVATGQMKAGDFSGQQPIYDPLTANANGVRQQFPGNIIPASRITNFAKIFQAAVPLPNAAGLSSNYIGDSPDHYNTDTFLIKIDHNISDNNKLSGSFRHQNNDRAYGYGPLPASLQGWFDTPDSRNAVLSDDWIIRPNLVNRLQLGYTRFQNPQEGFAMANHKLTVDVPGEFTNLLPAVGFESQGLTTLGDTAFDFEGDDNYNLQDSVSWTTGRHNLKFGVRWDRDQFNNIALDNQPGTYNFSQFETGQPGNTNTGNSYASFLLGLVNDATMATNTPIAERTRYFAIYAQDDWKISKRLTMNYGIRWEFQRPWYEAAGRLSQMDPNLPNPGAGGELGAMIFAGSGPGKVGGKNFEQTYYGGIGPRLGLAYQLDSKTVIRAGYAMMYAPLVSDNIGTQGYGASIGLQSPDGGVTPAFNIATGWPAGSVYRPPVLSPTIANGQATSTSNKVGRMARTMQWQMDVQRMIKNVLVDTSYVATVAHGIPNNYLDSPNQLNPQYLQLGSLLTDDINDPAVIAAGFKPPYAGFTGNLAQALRAFPQYQNVSVFDSPTGNSTYNAWLTKAEKRFSNGLQFLVSYSVSKTLTDVGFGAFGNTNWATPSGAPAPQDQFDRRAEKSLANNDIPQVLVASYTYELPFGKQKPFLNKGLSSRILGGFAVSGVHTYQSGSVLHIYTPDDLPIFNGYLSADRVAGVPIRIGPGRGNFQPLNAMTGQQGDVMLNIDGFSTPAPNTLGNLGVFLPNVRGFGLRTENISLQRKFSLNGENRFIQVRAELFNAFNRRNLNSPITDMTSPDFGRISGQGPARVAQFGFRLQF
jgi:hypothetical protein